MASRLASRASKGKPLPRTSNLTSQPSLTPDAWLAARTASALDSARRNSTVGIVVSAGLMDRAVKVQTTKQRFDTHLRRHYVEQATHLVSDPRESVRAGDVVRIAPWQRSGRISHVVTEIVKPFGDGKGGEMTVEERPEVMGIEELVKIRHEAWVRKQERRRERRRVAEAEAEAVRAAAEAEAEVEGRQQQAEGEGESEMAARLQRKKSRMADQGVEMEAEAEEIERRARAEDGEGVVDLGKRKEEMRSS